MTHRRRPDSRHATRSADGGRLATPIHPGSAGLTLKRRDLLGLGVAIAASRPSYAAEVFSWEPVTGQLSDPIVFTDDGGRPRKLSEFRGRPVLLNLWATWCAPCILELPALDRLQRDFSARRLVVVPLSLDRQGMPVVVDAYKRLKLRHLPRFVDATGDAAQRLAPKGLPASWAIAATGELVARRRGAVAWDDPAERERLQDLLKA